MLGKHMMNGWSIYGKELKELNEFYVRHIDCFFQTDKAGHNFEIAYEMDDDIDIIPEWKWKKGE